MGGRKVLLFQYLLIGAAMVIYYILLLSFSEQLHFNTAYLIALSLSLSSCRIWPYCSAPLVYS